ncbi:hypothetical protein JCM5353_005779 [Sporobolomyces roseus]
MQALLKPAVVPSLQAFALVDANEKYAEWLLQTDILALLPQLDALSIDMNVWTSLDATFRQRIATKTLVDCSSESMPTALTQPEQALNFRIYISPIDSMSAASLDEIAADVASSAAILEEAESSIPANLYLDHSLQLFHNLPLTLKSAIEAFTKVCEQKRVEIVWEDSPIQDFDVDPVISPEFWRRQRESRT